MHPTPNQKYLVLDYETYSETDLKKVGAFEYSAHPSTEILCAAWAIGTRETLTQARVKTYAKYTSGNSKLTDLKTDLQNGDYIIVAHNAYFEQVITKNILKLDIPPERWLCTASLAAALSIPRKLEGAAEVLDLDYKKFMLGHKIMLKLSKPKRTPKGLVRITDKESMTTLLYYCVGDVKAEIALLLKAPPLIPKEREVWILDQKINLRGVAVDRSLITTVLDLVEKETERLANLTAEETFGIIQSPTQRDQILKWLAAHNIILPDLRKNTVEAALAQGGNSVAVQKILQYRYSASKTSTAKYKAFEARSRFDGRIRDNLLYHGASTGRWSGAGTQPQNLPRPSLAQKDIDLAVDILKNDKNPGDMLRLIYGEPMPVFSDVIRSCLIASPGKVFDVADYSAIEARVLFWLARHKDGIAAYHENRPMYEEMAAYIFKIPVEKVTKEQRFLGKSAILGCGYSMSAEKFRITCALQGREISVELAEAAVSGYRAKNWPVVTLWKNLELAATAAIENPGKRYTVNGLVSYTVKDGFLWCRLPSGRFLAYSRPSIQFITPKWGGLPKKTITFWGVGLNRKWEEQTTYGAKLTENCFAGDTLVLTSKGWKPIKYVRKTDLVFDGQRFVSHHGVIIQGQREVVEWQGVQATEEHLILAGSNWKKWIALEGDAFTEALKLAHDLVPWWLRNQVTAKALLLCVNAIVRMIFELKLGFWREDEKNAQNAGIQMQVKSAGSMKILYRTLNFLVCGYIGIRGFFRDVLTKNVKLIKTTAGAVSLCILNGLKVKKSFSNTQKLLIIGINSAWTWIGSIMKKVMSQETLGWLVELKTQITGVAIKLLNLMAKSIHKLNFARRFYQTGKAVIHLPTILRKEKQPNKSLYIIKKHKTVVFDILNCGPQNRFVIMTNSGPVIAHNCSQAISRDLMAESMLRIQATKKWEIVLSVHDELISERDENSDVGIKDFCKLMSTLPEWAENCPVAAEGWTGKRYRK